ncbi:serine/threonine-protein kinase D3 isoform X2 [Eurytemora carolleeae]|uniref:serine/threonine-protein kinase D3 isoform X2 n=1 Tax=Eurytemora carolleeae TaxID=1294199 RepID=UPI000C75E532|nr:serine/threonine-protein kinase D3 isoform X2 [Eurytemora carolleeae]|eukprot:XP_023333340.1 serine/threonine-protein kinase D3-like isoform X2 [Eurytemora affinis]
MAEGNGVLVSFQFQVGLVRDRITVDTTDLTLKTIKVFACNFINEKFAEHGVTRLPERVMVYKHDYNSPNILQMVNSACEVQEGTILEVVLNTQPLGDDDVEIRPHSLAIHSYKTPTFCDFCGEMLFGMFKQGLKCEFCGLNYHKRCVFKIPNDCTHKKKRRTSFVGSTASSSTSLGYSSSVGATSIDGSNFLLPPARDGSVSPGTKRHSSSGGIHVYAGDKGRLKRSAQKIKNVLNSRSRKKKCFCRCRKSYGRPAWVDMQMATRLKIPHTFVLHTYTKPTKCHFCNKILVGVFKQGVQCKDCRFNAHKRCSEKVPRDCTGEVPDGSVDGAVSEGSVELEERFGEDSEGEDAKSRGSPDTEEGTVVTPSNFESHLATQGSSADYIPVQRLVQSIKHTKRVGTKILREGWLLHNTNKDTTKKKHYWRLDSKCITMFTSDTGNKFYKEIPLSEILSIDVDGDNPSSFQIRTANINFVVNQDTQSEAGATGSDDVSVQKWETAIRQALMPVEGGASGAAKPGADKSAAAPTPSAQEKEKDISQAYQIFPDDVLGSGQFGIVYGGVHRMSGRSVAIKVIDKMRFPTKQEAALKNEVSILQNIHHPGVVNLEKMFETPERIFVVMEKLKGDMLEMILSSERARLSERTTKFLVTQILVALKHLHSKNIVHCDLKPENVLLSSDSDFPQVKLCDFGYARIIGKKSFRKSIVGTPAYLAPEVLYSNVLKKRGFNRALDMWSTGVIIYVSLSGQFPFNEDVDIEDQIRNAEFMYPEKPWKTISPAAVSCIQHFLVVKHDARYTVEQALKDPWIDTAQCKSDLAGLEEQLGVQWLTVDKIANWEEDNERLVRKLSVSKRQK